MLNFIKHECQRWMILKLQNVTVLNLNNNSINQYLHLEVKPKIEEKPNYVEYEQMSKLDICFYSEGNYKTSPLKRITTKLVKKNER